MIRMMMLGLLMVLVTACGSEPKVDRGVEKVVTNVYRFVDYDAGVVCWGYVGNGLDCMPLSETKLEH